MSNAEPYCLDAEGYILDCLPFAEREEITRDVNPLDVLTAHFRAMLEAYAEGAMTAREVLKETALRLDGIRAIEGGR